MTSNRTFAISDIHGCCQTFKSLLELIQLTRNDTVYLLGDYIDRGSDSKGVIQIILELASNGFTIKPLMGNHEFMLLQYLDSRRQKDVSFWLKYGGAMTLKSYGITDPCEIDPEHIIFMKNLPFNHITDSHVFVHAGLDFSLRDPLSLASWEAMIWQRSSAVEPTKIGNRTVVSGHTIQTLELIKSSLATKYIRLDNGCYSGNEHDGIGNLVALELESGILHVQKYVD